MATVTREMVVLLISVLLSACDEPQAAPVVATEEATTSPEPPPAVLMELEPVMSPVSEAEHSGAEAHEEEEQPVVREREEIVQRGMRRRRGGNTGAGPPVNGACPRGQYLVESCVTGGMPRRMPDGTLTAPRRCNTSCQPRPPVGSAGNRCARTGPRTYHCEGLAP